MVNSSVNTNSFDRHLLSQTQREPHHSIRILLVDDRNSVRQHLRISLETEPDLQIIGEAINGQDAIAKIAALAPDIALVDLEMPVMSGLEATQIIKERFANTKVIIFSSHVSNEYVEESGPLVLSKSHNHNHYGHHGHAHRHHDREIKAEIRALEAEKRALKLEREAETKLLQADRVRDGDSAYGIAEPSGGREVMRVEKDRKGRFSLVRTSE